MYKTYNKFLFFFSLFLLLGGVYVYFSNTLSLSAAETSGLSSSTGAEVGAGSLTKTGNDKITQDTAFLTTLISLTKIRIDTSILSDEAFVSLVDNSVPSESVTPGRMNPFAPTTENTTEASTTIRVQPAPTRNPQ